MVFPGIVRRAMKLMPTLIQALALVVFIHVVGQGVLSRYGSAKYRFSKTYGTSGYGANKVQKVIKYIDSNVPRYSPKPGLKKAASSTPSTTSTTPRPPPSISQLEEEQKRRVEALSDTCTKYNLGDKSQNSDLTKLDPDAEEFQSFILKQNLPNRPMWQNLYCSKDNKISFCPVWKAASTFLLKKFLMLAPSGKYNKDSVRQLDGQANTLARKEFGYLPSWDMYPEFTEKGKTFIFVRHPFERILSAFRDKLEDPSVKGRQFNEYYYNKYGRRVVMYYRKEKITGPSFKYPRFSEFVDFLLDREIRYDDEHWAPFFKECTPCHIHYNFIGHFETLYWDIHLLANKTNLVDKWDDQKDYFQSSTYKKVSEEYFATIDRDKIRRLYKRYKIDFELFGYSPDDYIKMGKPGPDDVVEEIKIEEKETEAEVTDEKKNDEEVVNLDNISLNVIKNDLKENEIANDIEENEIKEVKTILSDDEKLITGESESDRT